MPKLILLVVILIESLSLKGQRVVGGEFAELGQFPWMTELFFFEGTHGCGATLIHPEWVLTAGHCIFAYDDQDFLMVANAPYYDYENPPSYAEVLVPDTFFVNPGWYDGMGPDLMLIHLSTPSQIQPIELISESDMAVIETGATALTMGWGTTLTSSHSDTLLWTELTLFDYDSCFSMYENSQYNFFEENFNETIVCGGYISGEEPTGSGVGDSGGPLLIEVDGQLKQIGVVFGGEESYATEEYPGLYTTILGNLDWINSTIENYEVSSIEEIQNASKIEFLVSTFNSGNHDISFEIGNSHHGEIYQFIVTDLLGRTIIDERGTLTNGIQELSLNNLSGPFVFSLRTEKIFYSETFMLR